MKALLKTVAVLAGTAGLTAGDGKSGGALRELTVAPPGLPFRWDEQTLSSGPNFTLATSLGDINLLGEITGGGYDALLPHCFELNPFGIQCHCLGLEHLIRVKRAAGRPKDLGSIAEFEVIIEESQRPSIRFTSA